MNEANKKYLWKLIQLTGDSLINKLPPELRRAGRDVLNDLRRRVPLGRITGGRVFPPFRIPPLNI